MVNKVRLGFRLGQTQGWGWLAYRARYTAELRLGWLRRKLPATTWQDQPLAGFLDNPGQAEPTSYLAYRRHTAPRFFFAPSDFAGFRPHFEAWDAAGAGPMSQVEALAKGRFTYFSGSVAELGLTPDWHRNPFTGQRLPADRHWTLVDEYTQGDIKVIWEPSRFGFAFVLARQYARDGDDRWPELFWRLVECWRTDNPPEYGPNWRCGQETTFRVMAWCFGLYAFLSSPTSTPERVANLAQMIAVSGDRIAGNLAYALSQRNNHSLSEPAGLWTIGVLFPEFAKSAHWRRLGREALEHQVADLFYDDGAFSQHSFNYQRLALHVLTWAVRLADLRGEPFSPGLKDRLGRAARLLLDVQDERSGSLPRYGHDDGALILPLSGCDYDDFRPVVQAAYTMATGSRCYDGGPWDEESMWLGGVEALGVPVVVAAPQERHNGEGGYHTLRAPSGFLFVRCPPRFRHRPGQADVLHADLWWRGQNVALDPGTFSYNAPPPWADIPLGSTTYHNTVTVDDQDQMDRAGRFLWLPWLHGRTTGSWQSSVGHLSCWEGEHDGYRRLSAPVAYRRAVVRLGDEHWLVLDELASAAVHSYRLHWLLQDGPYAWEAPGAGLRLETPAGPYRARVLAAPTGGETTLIRADDRSPRGWQATRYQVKAPALSLALTVQADAVRFLSLFGPDAAALALVDDGVRIEARNWRAYLRWGAPAPSSLIGLVTWRTMAGSAEDRLVIG